MAERIPPLTPRQSRSVAVYEEKKRLAEIAFGAIVASPRFRISSISLIGAAEWEAAVFMYDESERRRPHE